MEKSQCGASRAKVEKWEHRLLLGPDKKPRDRLMKMIPDCLRAWESEKKRISRSAWKKYFKGVIKA